MSLAPSGGWTGLCFLAVRIQCFVGRSLWLSGFGVRCFAIALGDSLAVRFHVGFFGGGSGYCRWVLIVLIACQISLAPRQSTAENGRGSSPGDWLRMAAMPCRRSL